MMIARWLETLIEMSRTLLEEEVRIFIADVSEVFENGNWWWACRV